MKTKEERFERVVEWIEEPSYLLIFFCSLVMMILIIYFITYPVDKWEALIIFLLLILGSLLFYLSLGVDKRVYWRRIK